MIFHRVSPAQQAIVNAMSFESCKQAVENDAQMGCLPGMVAGPYCRPFEGMGASFWYPCDCLTACEDKAYYRQGEMPRPICSYSAYAARERALVGDWRGRVVLVGELNGTAEDQACDPYLACQEAGGLMKAITGLNGRELIQKFARHSLCVGVWDQQVAALRAEWLMALYPKEPFILLGGRIADAFRVDYLPFFTHLSSNRMVTLPGFEDPIWNRSGSCGAARDALMNIDKPYNGVKS